MTVDPRLQLTPGEYLIHPDGSASKVVDKRNMTVDEILAGGRYADKRGRAWAKHTYLHGTVEWVSPIGNGACYINTLDEMRLLIIRDQHECVGLWACETHPVAKVVRARLSGRWWADLTGQVFSHGPYDTLPEAMDAARALAVGG